MRLFTAVRFPENVIESFSEIIRLGREAFPDARVNADFKTFKNTD